MFLPGTEQQSASIRALIQICSDTKDSYIDCQSLAETVGINKRRFYDILNVFETMGCVKKLTPTMIKWHGFQSFQEMIMKKAASLHLWDRQLTLSELIPSTDTCTICSLTINVFLLFIAMNTKVLNLKDICLFTIRDHGKFQSIMCKLYQLTHILCAADFITKINQGGDIQLIKPFLQEEDDKELSISSLLNQPVPYKMNFYEERRQEFKLICQTQKQLLAKQHESKRPEYSEEES